MKEQIRNNVWETNSSSTHALCYKRKELEPFNLPLDKDGKVHIYLDDEYEGYAGGCGEHYEQYDKLKYIITHLCNDYYPYYPCTEEDLCDRYYCYKYFIENIKRHEPKFNGIVIHGEGGVNHQLSGNLDEIVNIWNDDNTLNFLFNPEIGFVIDND